MNKEQKEEKILANNRVTMGSCNTDGVSLFMEVDVFDGEHTLKLYPVFPFDTSNDTLKRYLKELVDFKVTLPHNLDGLLGVTVYYDVKEEAYYMKQGTAEAIRQKEGVFSKK